MSRPRTSATARGRRAFTLVEVLVASTLGAMLLLATAGSAGLFGRQVEYLQEEVDVSVDEALADVRRDLHDAWIAEVPDELHLVLTEPSGGQTLYSFRQGVLTVRRADGSLGTLHDGLASVRFSAETQTRYREGTPLTRAIQVWNAAVPGSTTLEGYVLEPGEALALQFTLASPAPIVGTPVPGVSEQLIEATLTTLSLKLAAVTPAQGSLTLHVYRARGLGDGRPEGSSLGQVSIPLSSLPSAVMTAMQGSGGKKNKVKQGNNGNAYAYGHANGNNGNGNNENGNNGNDNGDNNGNGNNGNGNSGGETWDIAGAPTQSVPITLSSLGLTLEPGYAYTFVLDNTASDGIVLAGEPIASATASGIALGAGGAYASESVAVARSLSATARATTTTPHAVVQRVRVEFVTQGGAESVATALVAGQHAVADPWLGAVPGETAP
jgi:prepilin-type N-terminal cleavage/methylation domain-containing protein